MNDHKTVALFVQCIVDSVYPHVAESMVKILRHLGVSVSCPEDQTCCGQPAFNSGYHKEARIAARHFIRVFENTGTIVCPSGSCTSMIRNHYPELFEQESDWQRRAKRIGQNTYEFTQYLVDVMGITDVGAARNATVTYHDSCHLLRWLNIREQPRKLVRNIRGVSFVEMFNADHCCGFGGAFSVKYPRISAAMLEDKVKNIIDSGADIVTGCDMGCLMNIQGMLSRKNIPVKAIHIAQLLAESM